MTTPRPKRRRTRARTTAQPPSDDVARVLARRDKLDAARAEDRDRENKLLAEYFTVAAEEVDIEARRDALLADLDDQRQAAIDDARRALAATETRRAATIMALNKRRSVQHLVAMLELPRRRIDKLIRLHNELNTPQKNSLRLVKGATESDEADIGTRSTAGDPSSTPDQSRRPLKPSADPTSAAVAEPDGTPAADRAPTDGPADPSPDTARRPPPDDPERLF